MHIQLNINTELEINSLTDLPKLKMLMESSHMKINKSQLDREMEVDRRTIGKYLDDVVKKNKFQSYFDARSARKPNHEVIRYETPPAEQAQLDWKENIKYITKDGEVLYVNILVLLLSYSRFRILQLSISKSQSVLLSFIT